MYPRSHTSRRSAIVTTGVPAATYSPGSAFLERTVPFKGEKTVACDSRVLARANPSPACFLRARAWSIASFLAPSFTRERFSFAPATAARAWSTWSFRGPAKARASASSASFRRAAAISLAARAASFSCGGISCRARSASVRS